MLAMVFEQSCGQRKHKVIIDQYQKMFNESKREAPIIRTHKCFKVHWVFKTIKNGCCIGEQAWINLAFIPHAHEEFVAIFHLVLLCSQVNNKTTKL